MFSFFSQSSDVSAVELSRWRGSALGNSLAHLVSEFKTAIAKLRKASAFPWIMGNLKYKSMDVYIYTYMHMYEQSDLFWYLDPMVVCRKVAIPHVTSMEDTNLDTTS